MSDTQNKESVNTLGDDLPLEDVSLFKCSCARGKHQPYPEKHDSWCRLHDSWHFTEGWVVWDELAWKLVDRDTYEKEIEKERQETEALNKSSATPLPAVGSSLTTIPATPVGSKPGDSKAAAKPTVTTSKSSTYSYFKCRHYQEPVKLRDGTIVYASSQHSDRQNDPTPDLGIYLDGMWKPDTVAYHVGCPDMGIPIPSVDKVLRVAREGLRVAREGGRVEVGCIGGHGRTGLFLAIMHLLTMEKPSGARAIKYIRSKYCSNAIESAKQEWYIKGIACELKGQKWPPAPKPKVWKSTTSTYSTGGFTSTPSSSSYKHADNCVCFTCKPHPAACTCYTCKWRKDKENGTGAFAPIKTPATSGSPSTNGAAPTTGSAAGTSADRPHSASCFCFTCIPPKAGGKPFHWSGCTCFSCKEDRKQVEESRKERAQAQSDLIAEMIKEEEEITAALEEAERARRPADPEDWDDWEWWGDSPARLPENKPALDPPSPPPTSPAPIVHQMNYDWDDHYETTGARCACGWASDSEGEESHVLQATRHLNGWPKVK